MDPRCETCRHWTEDEMAQTTLGFKRCKSPKVRFATTRAMPPEYEDEVLIDNETELPIPPDGAGVLDGSGYWAALVTGAEFGCVHHEPR